MSKAKKKNPKKRQRRSPSPRRRYTLRTEFPPEIHEHLLKAVETKPEDILARLELAEFYLRNDEEDKILDVLRELEERFPFSDRFLRGYYHRLRAFGFAHRGDFVKAEEAAHAGLKEYPQSLDFYYLLSYVYVSLKEFTRAIEMGERFVSLWKRIKSGSLAPQDFSFTGRSIDQLYNILGTAYQEQGELQQARKNFEAAIKADPGNHLPYINLANLLKKQGEEQAAERLIQKGLEKCRQVHELRMLAQVQEQNATVSACMIVKNEEELLPGCLDSIRDWVDEIIIVDTGSTDKTVEIAKSYGAKIFHQPWEGNFSKHRNYSIEQATGEWIFIIDADERIYPEDVGLIKKVLNQNEYNIISINVFNVTGKDEEHVTFLPSIRFFRRRLNLRYTGIVHNLLIPPDNEPIMRAGIRLKHYGYGLSPEKMQAKMERSKALLEKQIAEDPNNAFALFNYAQLLRGQGVEEHPENAQKIIDAAQRALELTHPDVASERHIHIMTHHQLGWVYFVLGDYDKAERYCLDVLKFKPDYLDALLLLGHIYLRQELFEKAQEYYHKYIETQARYNETCETDNIIILHPRSLPSAYYGLGLAAEHTEELEKARQYYRKVFHLSPGFMDAAIRLGRIYLYEHEYEEARRCFEKKLELEQDSIPAMLGLAEVAFLSGKKEEAAPWFERALAAAPRDGSVLMSFGKFLLESGEEERAIEVFQQAAQSEETAAKARRQLAEVYFRQQRYEEAAEVYRSLLENEEQDGELLNNLANCYYRAEQWEKAEEHYQQALSLPSAPTVAYRNLGVVQAKIGKISQAIENFEKFAHLEPSEYDTYHIIGDLYSRAGRFEQAIPYYEKFLHSSPHDAVALYKLSECYLNMGHRDSAVLGYRRALRIDPNFEPARVRLAEVSEPAGKV